MCIHLVFMFVEVAKPMKKKTHEYDKHKIFSFAQLFSIPHSSTPNYMLTDQSTPAHGRRGKKKAMKDCFLSARIKERTVEAA